ncbi:MAG: hypothetical protein AAFQ40_07115 [Cyanobacteria bacterium J06623_5]
MRYTASTRPTGTQTTGADRAIAGILVAGVTFILGYIVVRTSLAYSAQQTSGVLGGDIEVVVPHEGTLWADVHTRF